MCRHIKLRFIHRPQLNELERVYLDKKNNEDRMKAWNARTGEQRQWQSRLVSINNY